MLDRPNQDHAPSGLETVPNLPWGSHVGQLFSTGEGMRDALVAYFRAGLDNNERCLWVTGEPLEANEARAALRAVVPDLDARERRGDIEIQNTDFFYDREQPLQPAALVEGLLQREQEALAAGYEGVRTNGNCAWVEARHWDAFSDYEARVQDAVRGRRLICMCSYSHESHGGKNLFDVVARHDLILRPDRAAPNLRAEAVTESGSIPTARTTLHGALVEFQEDLDAIAAIAAVPTILEIVSRTTGMGFSAVARVTPERWVCLAVNDEIAFGLKPGGELKVDTTLCHEVRQARDAIVIDHVAEDAAYRNHHTPAMYGLQSYISMPIFLHGAFWGTLCAIDPKPALVKNPTVIGMFRLFADLISMHLQNNARLSAAETNLVNAHSASRLREQFVAVLGHDLRNPLAAITAGSRLLRHETLSERGTTVIQMMEKSAWRMAQLVDDVTDLTRARLGNGIQITPTNAPLLPVLEQVIDELRTMHPERRIDANLNLTRATFADNGRIGRLLSNLLGNAIKYSAPDTPIKVQAHTYGAFTLSVTNDGPAIPPPTLEKLFLPFARGDTHPSQDGLGLGLYIVSEVARAHNGTINVNSTDEATTFTFAMPLPPEPRAVPSRPIGPVMS